MMLSQKTILRIVFPLSIIIIFGCLIISRLLWPADSPKLYSDIWDTISGLGDMEDNPIGFIFFQIAMTLMGVLSIPVVLYVHPRLIGIAEKKGGVRLGSFWLLMGAIGFLLTGLIPDGVVTIPEWDKFHEITAGLGSLGIIFAAFFYFSPCKNAGEKINQKVLWIITAVWWIPIILTGIAYGLAELMVKEVWYAQCNLGWYGAEWGECGVSWFYSFAVWERVLFTVMVIYQLLLVKMIPEN
jgi:hypothetical protein